MIEIKVIVDLDGTLCNVGHRKHFAEQKDWKSFYENMIYDQPNQWCLALLKRFWPDEIIFITGRPEQYRPQTMEWLTKIGYEKSPVFMRTDGDHRQDSEVKVEIYKEHIQPYHRVSFCIEDRTQVVQAWRALGLVCLQCDEGNF